MYSKLLLCNSANNKYAWFNKKISEWNFYVFVFEKNKTLFIFKNKQKQIENNQNICCFFKRFFLKPEYLSIVFCDIPLIERCGTIHVTISLIGYGPHT